MMSTSLTGAKELDRKFDAMAKAVQNKIGKKAITAGAKAMAKEIKKQIPSRWKGLRKAIGHSVKRPRSGRMKGVITAKAGAGVGMKKDRRAKLVSAHEAKGRVRRGKTRPGVGQSAANAHWFLAGTAERSTGSRRVGSHKRGAKTRRVLNGGKVRRTGRLRPSGIVQRANAMGTPAVMAIMRGELARGIMREAANQ